MRTEFDAVKEVLTEMYERDNYIRGAAADKMQLRLDILILRTQRTHYVSVHWHWVVVVVVNFGTKIS